MSPKIKYLTLLLVSLFFLTFLVMFYARTQQNNNSETLNQNSEKEITMTETEKVDLQIVDSIPKKDDAENEEIPEITLNPVLKSETEIMAWLYPGTPACNAEKEYSDGRKINILKPEYFKISEEGELVLLTEQEEGCNGYSKENITKIKKYSDKQFVTISSSYAVSMNKFLVKSKLDEQNIKTLLEFVTTNNISGVEIDFEDFGGWTEEYYQNYKDFVLKLGKSLHKINKELMIDGPAISNNEEQSWFLFKYEDFVDLPVDYIVVMAYDYQYDHGSGKPVSPLLWINNVIDWTVSKYPNKEKITIGIPSYGYKSLKNSNKFSLLTLEQAKKEQNFDSATRDINSAEMYWQNKNYIYFYQDQVSMQAKRQLIEKKGIKSISVWHLGGNDWF